MKLRERWLPLAVTALLVVCCTALPFLWFAARDRQLDSSTWREPASGSFLSAAGRANDVARELYYWRQQTSDPTTYQPVDATTAQNAVFPCLAALRSAKVLPKKYLDAADVLIAQAAEYSVGSEANGMTTYHFRQSADGPYLNFTLSEYGVLTNLSGSLGLRDGFVSADVAKAYRTMLGLNVFTDWVDAEPHGYGTPAPYYSADAQLYLVANMDRGYFSLSVTSMAPETYAGL